MRKNLIFGMVMMCSLLGHGQVPAVKTFGMKGNPIVTDKFTADPAPMVHDGTLYLYVGHDEARVQHYGMAVLFHKGHEDVDRPWGCIETY